MDKKDKIRTSNGTIYDSCPYVDRIQEILQDNESKFKPEELAELNQKLELIRRINSELREESGVTFEVQEPYNFAAVLKQIKIMYPEDKEKINDIIKLYY